MADASSTSPTHFDVLIIGAGVSGIGMACMLKSQCPHKSFAILERRQNIGGTWDLFKYPGIRSDSDMYTFGYGFRPWTGGQVLANGASIKQYVTETAQAYGVTSHIQFGWKVVSADWSSAQKRWTLQALREASGEQATFTAGFIVGCTGYYNYDQGYKPDFAGEEDFAGQIIQPQFWPENLDYSGKKVVVIGSGATAITLVPTMAGKAGHVTMLQRSPSYLLPLPAFDVLSVAMQKLLPDMLAYRLTRARNVTVARTLFERARKHPKAMRRFFLRLVKAQVGDKVDMRHFSPSYNPWEQRLCVVADGDLFKALKKGTASIETDHIERFDKTGIVLKSGKHLEADIIIPATGLNLQMLGGIQMTVDGAGKPISETMIYKNALVEGVPNAAMIFGYTNISWTLKVDIVADYVCRLLKHMDKNGHQSCVPVAPEGMITEDTIMGSLSSGYVARAQDQLPKQGKAGVWQARHNYLEDFKTLKIDGIEDEYLQFDGARGRAKSPSRLNALIAPVRAALGV
jgi:cation diffusion facilitator CzcD-associated flavoprotein CzcO